MTRPLHPVSDDEADRHVRPRRVPLSAALVIAALLVALLAYLHARGVSW